MATPQGEKGRPPIGAKLKELREMRGWSLREVERRTGGRIRSSHLSQIESGKVHEPSLSVLRELAEAFDLHLGSLLSLLEVLDEPEETQNEALVLSFMRQLPEEQQAEAVEFLKYFADRSAARS